MRSTQPTIPSAPLPRRRGRRALARAVLLACGALTPRLAPSQPAANSDMVPRKVLDAILATDFRTGMGSGPPQLQLGSVPPLVVSEIDVPAGADVLGSLVYGQTTDLLLIVPLPPDSARVALERSLVGRGWRRPPSPQRLTGGLLYGPVDYSPTRMMCKGSDAYVTITTSAKIGARASTMARVSFQNGDSQCNMQERVVTMSTYSNPFAAVPPLYPPSGFSMTRCGSGINGAAQMTQTYATPLEPNELLAHYARQFEAAGWKSSGMPNVRLGSWTGTDSTGKAREASLMISTIPGQKECYSLSLAVTRN